MLRKIVSGGQTGADRAALEWAIQTRGAVEYGGWCPAGRKAEDGPIDERFLLQETPSESYAQRTEWNVRDSDATVIFSLEASLSGGSQLTLDLARKWKRPCLHISQLRTKNAVEELRQFVDDHFVEVLNVAGPRKSSEPGIGEFVTTCLDEALG